GGSWRTDRGLFRAGSPGADRADIARRRPALARHRQRHAGRCDRARPAPLDRGPRHLGDRPCVRRMGRAPRSAIRGRGPAPPSLSDVDAAMMSLREYRNRAAHLADFLPWAALVGEGVVLNKDGSLQRTARFRGPDLDSATP